MFEIMDNKSHSAVIKVVGVGGGGGNAVERMLVKQIEGVQFICANTDAQALRNVAMRNPNAKILQLGDQITRGLGAGADPRVGRDAALADRDYIADLLKGSDMVFITAGLGGGTGTGAAPVVAEIAKDLGILTVAVVTKPFGFEGKQRAASAELGIKGLIEFVDSLITIPNDRLLTVYGKDISLVDVFDRANDVLYGAVQGIAELITLPGLINVDFADVRTVMSKTGMAMMGTASAKGENRALLAAEAAARSPLLDDITLIGAQGILVNVTANNQMSIGEFQEVGMVIEKFKAEDATVVMGTVIDNAMEDELRVTVIATGLGRELPPRTAAGVAGYSGQRTKSFDALRRDTEYHHLDRPAVIRKQNPTMANPVNKATPSSTLASSGESEYLDIPAFLRRQEQKES